jgi:hypothetical protein
MKLATLLTTVTLAAATATAAAETFRHPAGVELPLPQGWHVQSEGGLTVLMPSEPARDASGPKEIYLFAIGPTYGVSRVSDPRLAQNTDQELRQMIPAMRHQGSEMLRTAAGEAIAMSWQGRSPEGKLVSAQVFASMGEGFVVTLFALGESSVLESRQAELREIVAGLSIGQGTIDRKLVGLWTYSNSSVYNSGYGDSAMSFATESRGALQLNADGTFAMQDSSILAGGGADASFQAGDDEAPVQRGRWFASDGMICAICENGTVISAQYACDGSTLQVVSQLSDFRRTYRAGN